MLTVGGGRAIVVDAVGWAPVALKVICFTPLPPALAVALREMLTLLLFQPAALGAGDCVAVVVGGVVLAVAPSTQVSLSPKEAESAPPNAVIRSVDKLKTAE